MWQQDRNNRGAGWEPQPTSRNLAQRHQVDNILDDTGVNQDTSGNNIGDRIEKLAQKLPNFDHLIRALEQEYASAKTELVLLKEEYANGTRNLNQNTVDMLKQSFESKCEEVKQHTDSLTEERNKLKQFNELLVEDIAQMEKQISKLKRGNQKLQTENDDLKSRLSQVMENKLINNNPQIVDLSDKNRPSKLADRFSELYDNEWTDAYEVVSRDIQEERNIIATLLEILMFIDNHCRTFWYEYASRIEREITLRKSLELPDFIDKQLKDCCKNMAPQLLDYVQKSLEDKSYTVRTGRVIRSKDCEGFINGCAEICWLMAAQDPPVVFGTNFKAGDNIDSTIFRAYTKQGKTLDFVVWPPLLLHEGGPLLSKGVAQAKVADSIDGVDETSARNVISNDGNSNVNDNQRGSSDETRVTEGRYPGDDKQSQTPNIQSEHNNTAMFYGGALQEGSKQKSYEQTNIQNTYRQTPNTPVQGVQRKEWKYRKPRENELRLYHSYLRGAYTEHTIRYYLGEDSFDLCRDYYNFLYSK